MKIVQAAAGDTEEILSVQARHFACEPGLSAIQSMENAWSIEHSLKTRIWLKAERRGGIAGVVRGQDRGRIVYVDALWVPDFARRTELCVLLLGELEGRFPNRATFHVRAAHRNAKCFDVYKKAGYEAFYEERKENGILLRLYEKRLIAPP
ncbi:GNAT family N-acetyltransferase [Cohnella caldifontis]|uniref:GNAT family N-acetyltransferase n=1 Tax=Cohnella caldifontis TaxID=3027471 RepID=UPI0023EB8417|nr:GNAT family N-acetyltransferase [Cohnella sp. YIM B05605]